MNLAQQNLNTFWAGLCSTLAMLSALTYALVSDSFRIVLIHQRALRCKFLCTSLILRHFWMYPASLSNFEGPTPSIGCAFFGSLAHAPNKLVLVEKYVWPCLLRSLTLLQKSGPHGFVSSAQKVHPNLGALWLPFIKSVHCKSAHCNWISLLAAAAVLKTHRKKQRVGGLKRSPVPKFYTWNPEIKHTTAMITRIMNMTC